MCILPSIRSDFSGETMVSGQFRQCIATVRQSNNDMALTEVYMISVSIHASTMGLGLRDVS